MSGKTSARRGSIASLVALAALAASAPIAAARPVDTAFAHHATPAPVVETTVVHQGGFDWGDAAIGAIAAAGVLGAAGTGLVMVRRHAGEPQGAAAAR